MIDFNDIKRQRLQIAHTCLDKYYIEGLTGVFLSAYYIDNHKLLEGFAKWEEFQSIDVYEYPWMFGSLYFEVDGESHYFLLYKIIGVVGESNGDIN